LLAEEVELLEHLSTCAVRAQLGIVTRGACGRSRIRHVP
jgi:hypothetical protein